MGRWEEINLLWEQYFKLSVYKKEYLIKPLFHFWMGVYLTHNYKILSSAQYKTFRIHPFIIGTSGSGKSIAMKTTHFLLLKIGFNSFYNLKTTDASLVGSHELIKGKIIKNYGLLKERQAIFWDEGSVLLKGGSYSENVCDVVQMATDDPGFVSKATRLGQFEYTTTSSICTGSYPDDNIEKTILHRGLFQRMFVCYNEHDQDEILDYIKNKDSIINSNHNDRIELVKKIKELLPKPSSEEQAIIKVNKEDYKRFCEFFYDYITKKMRLFKDKKQQILDSFISRNDQILTIAGQRAILFDRNEVKYEDLEYGFNLYLIHLKGANDLLMSKAEKPKEDMLLKREIIIKKAIGEKTFGICELRDFLIQQEYWDLGKLNTYQIINNMVERNKINVRIEDKGKKILFNKKERSKT